MLANLGVPLGVKVSVLADNEADRLDAYEPDTLTLVAALVAIDQAEADPPIVIPVPADTVNAPVAAPKPPALTLRTPVFDSVISPEAFATPMPDPAVSVPNVYPVPLPISS
jgi:hypothetical protein